MKRLTLVSLFAASAMLAACSGMPKLFWEVDEGKNQPDYARGASADSGQAEGRPPLTVPPELRNEVRVPMPDQVATREAMPEHTKQLVAGKAVRLDTRLYPEPPATVFSAVIDAMTALNLPVDSVDSPSGTITTEWVRPDVNTPNSYLASVMNIVGAGPVYTRYRYVVRVLRARNGQTMLQVRTLGQQFINRHWVNKELKPKLAADLFGAVEERLASIRTKSPSSQGGARIGQPATTPPVAAPAAQPAKPE